MRHLDAPMIDPSVPNSARIWNYWLGGKDNFEVDRAAGETWIKIDPSIVEIARASRAFLNRAVAYLAGSAGVRQFLEMGTGLPMTNNTHEVAQAIEPSCRVVYVDNDPIVLAHARALLVGTPEGATEVADADIADTDLIIERAGALLDFDQPVGLLFIGVLGHVPDLDTARGIVIRLLGHLPAGSYLALSDHTLPVDSEARERMQQAEDEYAGTGAAPYRSRASGDIASLFAGLDLVDPGFVRVPLWRPGSLPGEDLLPAITPPVAPSENSDDNVFTFGGVARKPSP